MLNQYIRFSDIYYTDFTVKLIVSLAALCLVGPVVITIEKELPITLQTLVILFFSIAFGWRIGTLATLLYIVVGLMGVPVFAGHTGGIGHLNGVFGGFFFGFIIASLLCGFLAELAMAQKIIVHLMIWFLGHFIILLLGAIWLRRFNPEGWQEMIYLAIPGAAAKSAVGFFILQMTHRISSRFKVKAG